MKALKLLSTLLIIVFIATSCDEAKDLVKKDLTFSLDETFVAAAIDGEFSQSRTFSALDDGNISDNINNIKGYSVESMSIVLENLVTDNSPSLDGFAVSVVQGSESITLSVPGPISLSLLEAAGETDVTIPADALSTLTDMIESGENITLSLSTTMTDGPASFDLTISIQGKVTVGL